MIRYLKIEESGIITDMISYQFGDYVKVEKEVFPIDLHNGCYRYIDGEFVADAELFQKLEKELLDLKQEE